VTIAAINGHGELTQLPFLHYPADRRRCAAVALIGDTVAFAGGFLLALCCDYRLMTDGKAWCCMNEVSLARSSIS
jgi:hypothetical protein